MKKYVFKIRLLPVIAFAAVVMLLLKVNSYSVDIPYNPDLPINADSVYCDIFCLVKADACLYISIWAFLTLLYLFITGQIKLKRTRIYIPMAIYSAFVLVSFAFSSYKSIAWYGAIDRFEGTRTILCYMFMLFYTINVVDELRDVLTIIVPVMVSVFIACIIGLTQLAGCDILVSQLDRIYASEAIRLEAEFHSGQVYQTVYNMNYVGMYLTLIIPILVFIVYEGVYFRKNKTVVAASAVLIVLIALNLYGADSAGGIIGIVSTIVFMSLIFIKKRMVRALLLSLLVVGFVGTLATMYICGADTIKSIDYIVTGPANIRTSIDGNELLIEYDKATKEYSFYDADGNALVVLPFEEREGNFQIEDSRFKGKILLIPIDNEGESIFYFDAYNEEFLFRMDGDEVLYINPYLNNVPLNKVDSVFFKGHLSAGSGRGYIWSRTIPLLKKHILVGSGADTFMMEFPQNDYAGKYSASFFLTKIIDKPHNMYFQMIVCTGAISCLAFIAMLVVFIYEAFKSNDKLKMLIAAGIFGFAIAGLFNDSTVCIMPIFYSFLGIGIGDVSFVTRSVPLSRVTKGHSS